MCELFGVSSKRCVPINEYLYKFYSHCEQHPHGWGLAIMQQNQSIIEKQPKKACESEELTRLLSQPIIVEHVFAHIRLATMGYTDSFNCHPFSRIDNAGRTWTLMHNGTIFKYEGLDKYISKQIGETDSERILLYIIDQINNLQDELERALNPDECFKLLEDIITDLAKGNKLNIMIFNGEFMYIHANYKQSLYYLEKEDSIFVSTKPLTDEKWKEFPINRLIGIKNSEIIYRGKEHGNEYNITEEDFNFILDHVSPELKNNLLNNFGDLNYAKEYQLKHQ
ncbi:MAG: hypothetical protein BZ135_00695 [Methanosphaera sp. rholeuAM6]|nr:MAG: hypothetical protein BZ135_00695 [Methanosphaera sp. rholeuAM6]